MRLQRDSNAAPDVVPPLSGSLENATKLTSESRSSQHEELQRSVAKDQSALRLRTRDIAYWRPRFGYERIQVKLSQ